MSEPSEADLQRAIAFNRIGVTDEELASEFAAVRAEGFADGHEGARILAEERRSFRNRVAELEKIVEERSRLSAARDKVIAAARLVVTHRLRELWGGQMVGMTAAMLGQSNARKMERKAALEALADTLAALDEAEKQA